MVSIGIVKRNRRERMKMNDKMYEELKRALFMRGIKTIEDVLGYEIDAEEEPDTTDNRLDAALGEATEEEITELYNKYCLKRTEENTMKWTEIITRFTDESEGILYVDGYMTDDQDEEGTVIAKININTYEVIYVDVDAQTDTYVQQEIEDAIERLKQRNNYIAEERKPKIIIEVKDGMVQAVYSDIEDMEIIINDKDTIPEEDCEFVDGMTQIY